MSQSTDWAHVAGQVYDRFLAGDQAGAIALLETASAAAGTGEPGAPPGFREVTGALYWKHKSLAGAAWLSLEVARRLEEAATVEGVPDERIVRPLAGTYYNLASFCWDGWDEPGIEITPELLQTGREAAAKALAIRLDPRHQEMRFGFSPAMAHWMVGGFQLSARAYTAAREAFETAAEANRRAGENDLLERGYARLAECLAAPESEATRASFQTVLDELAARTEDKNAAFFRDQLLTAERAFRR